jgi:hypothetical protein
MEVLQESESELDNEVMFQDVYEMGPPVRSLSVAHSFAQRHLSQLIFYV